MRRNKWRGLIAFNHVAPEELGRIRTLKVSDRYVSERNLQAVQEGGHLLASLAIPTVLKITCDFFVSAENRQGLTIELKRLARWLEDPGEGKLELRSLPGKYYLARCMDLGEPVYTGLSAKVTATFICRDYRPYNAYNDLPDYGMDPQTDNFTFGGIHCLNDMGCLFVLEKKPALPAINPYKIAIPGIAGTIRYDGSIEIEEREMTGTLYFVNRADESVPLSHAESAAQMHKVAAWLANAGRAALVWDADPARTWQAEVTAVQDYDRSGWQSGKIKLRMQLQPVSEGALVEKSVSLSLSANTEKTIDLTDLFPDDIGYETPLRIEIRNAGSRTVTDLCIAYPTRLGTGLQRYNGNGFSLASGKTMLINGDERMATFSGTAANLYILSGDFPAVIPGQLWIKIQSTVATTLAITVQAKSRWI